jgi:hypothetical protein
MARRRNNLSIANVSIVLGIKNAFQHSSADVKSRIVKRSFFPGDLYQAINDQGREIEHRSSLPATSRRIDLPCFRHTALP